MSKKHFKISSALKNIIGKDLISDDFVAIFELVKNSFDANAKKVDVIFKNPTSDLGSVIIKDNGKGMDLLDLEEKWLFVAYSAKKEGTEDYRDEIKSKRIYAGAKGIGRFSCDRLGKQLTIYSRKKESDKISKLFVNWEDFEKNISKKFEAIPVTYELVDTCNYDLNTGTVLEISNIRAVWDADKLIDLRSSLEKLINPAQSNGAHSFSINIQADLFKEHDKEAKNKGETHRIINGRIKNFLFEKLELKSTHIEVKIDKEGDSIETILHHHGEFVYRMIEENLYSYDNKKLRDINVYLFSMNQASKALFTKYMGVRPVNFGSVFVYKNGFRIHPIGEIGRGDIFGLDNRKQQGTSRFFGTRDLIGRIEINGNNEEFQEASSRDGGLARNNALETLQDFFIEHVLKRLERFAIGVARYGNIEEFDTSDLSTNFSKEKALTFIDALTKSKGIHDIEYNSDIFDVVSNASEKSLNSLLKNLSQIANESDNSKLEIEVEKIQSKLEAFSKATKDAESEAREERAKRKAAEKAAKESAERAKLAEEEAQKYIEKNNVVTKQTMFLKSMVSSDLENVVALHHHIGIAAGTIENYVRGVSNKIRSGKPMTTDSFLRVLDEISFVARQISSTTKFATKANFNLEAELIEKDLCGYIEEYIINICSGLVKIDKDFNTNMKFIWNSNTKEEFITEFRPLEIAMVLDSLVNNSVKAGAQTISCSVDITTTNLILHFRDDGHGIKESIRSDIFDMGFTTSKGSGLGLHHSKNIMSIMKGSIELGESTPKGTEFIIKFPRK